MRESGRQRAVNGSQSQREMSDVAAPGGISRVVKMKKKSVAFRGIRKNTGNKKQIV